MARLEDELFFHIKAKLDWFKLRKIVIHFDDIRRLNLKYIKGRYFSHKQKGTPDIVVYIKNKTNCYILFIEIKTPNDRHRPEQLQFLLKFRDLTNVWYLIARNPSDVENKIEEITGFYAAQLEEMKGKIL